MDLPHIGLLVTVMIAYSGFLFAVIKVLLDRYVTAIEKRLDDQTSEIKELKTQYANHLANLPIQYVRSEACKACWDEWIRHYSNLDKKLEHNFERMSAKIDDLRKELYERYRRTSASAD